MKAVGIFASLMFSTSLFADEPVSPSALPAPSFLSEQERAIERQRLEQKSHQIEEQYKLDTQDCYQKFDVVNCKIAARERRITAKAALRKEERPFKAMERQIKTEEAKQRLVEKQTEAEMKLKEAERAESLIVSKEKTDANAQKQIDHALKGTKRGDYEQKQREAAQHRADAEKRLRERGKDAAAPLPVPGQ
jgi:hypothetical protein